MRTLKLPTPFARNLVKALARFAVGPQERFGVPRPTHPIHREHATIGPELLQYVAYDWIRMQSNIAAFEGRRVRFTDGTEVDADAVVYATGYDASFPFLSDDLVNGAEGGGRLYRRILHPDAPGLYFAGLIQPVGPTIPLVEIQGRWIARAIDGQVALPGKEGMAEEIEAHRRWVEKSFVGSQRYRLEVDFRDYAGQLTEDMAA